MWISVRRIIAKNSSVVSWVKMKVDEGQIEADDIAFGIFPDFLANQPVTCRTANRHSFVNNLDGFRDRHSRFGHGKKYSTGRIFLVLSEIGPSAENANSANPEWIRAVVFLLKADS